MTALLVILFVVAVTVAAASLITRVTYVRRHPAQSSDQRRRSLIIALVVAAAAIGLGVGLATSNHGITLKGVIGALVILIAVALYAIWRFTPTKDASTK
jgi:predicted Co/Zn/Cd cation transporter (cation efflux family)